MRPNRLRALLLVPVLCATTVPVRSADADLSADGLFPPGVAARLARDQGIPAAGEGPILYVVVTSRSLRDEFLVLARARVRNGIPSAVRSLESLRSDYPVATDDADRVRRFLRDAHDHWGTRWVLLGGDTDVLPARHASVRDVLGDRSFVSDWYYACLDGTWDADGDGRYGEPPDPFTGDPGDAADLVPELFVGRAPVSGRDEAGVFVRKTLAYERSADASFEHSTLMFANRLAPFFDLAQGAELLLPLIADDPAQQVTRFYESWDDPAWVPGVLPETRASVLAGLGQGHNVVIGFGGGAPDLLEAGDRSDFDQRLTVPDVLALGNGDRAGHVWLATSFVGAFDHPISVAEAFLRAPGGGAVTVVAPSDLTFVTQVFVLIRRLTEVVFDEGAATIGEALVRARADLVAGNLTGSIVMTYQLLGDPLLRVFSASPVAAAREGPDHGRTGITGATRGRDETVARDLTTGLFASAPAASAAPGRMSPLSARLALSAPRPSPAATSVRVECVLPEGRTPGDLDAAVIDLAGRVVRTLGGVSDGSGAATMTWDLRDAGGRRVSPGVYFLRARAGDASRTVRVLVAPAP